MSALAQKRRHPAGHQKWAERVDAPRFFELKRVDIDDVLSFVEQDRGVVDEDIEAAHLLFDEPADRVDRLWIRGVESVREGRWSDLRRRFGSRVATAARDDD